MKIKYLLLFTLLSLFGYGQNLNSYIEYHKKCRMAEKYFLKDSVLQCFSTYNDVFSHNELLFPRDCFMAAQIAHSVDNDSLAIEYLLKGISFGLNPDFFSIDTFETNASKLKDLKNCRFWTKVIYKKDSLMKIYRNKVDWKLKKELMSLIRTDQNWRRKNNKWFNRNFRPGLEKKFNIFNQKCMLYLDSVFNSVGYPGNWLIGTGDSLAYQTKYASFNNANLGDLVSVLLYHNDSAFINYGDFLLKEIDNGHIHPRVYALIRDFRDRHLDKKDKEEIMYYNIWWERGNLSVDEIENHCNEIGCPTKQHLRDLSNKLGKGYDVFWSPFR